MKTLIRLKYRVIFFIFMIGTAISAQEPAIDSIAQRDVAINIANSEESLITPVRTKINTENNELNTLPIWKVSTRPEFMGPGELSAFVSDQIMEIENKFGTKVKSGQAIYETFINIKGDIDHIAPTVSGGKYLDECFTSAIQETSGCWKPATHKGRKVRTSIKIKVQYKLEWHSTWTKLLITAQELK